MNLERFLSLPDVTDLTEEIEINERLGTFKIKPMTGAQWDSYKKRCTITTKKKTDVDYAKLNLLVITGQVIEPNFSNAEFLSAVGCSTASEFVSKKFLAGEIQDVSDKIVEASGFDTDINEDIEEAKN